jgi:hypothetical protein
MPRFVLSLVVGTMLGAPAVAMDFNVEDVQAGVAAANQRMRFFIEGYEADASRIEEATTLISNALGSAQGMRWGSRAVIFASEIIATGVNSRAVYDEPGLTVDEVQDVLPILDSLWNSWTHE